MNNLTPFELVQAFQDKAVDYKLYGPDPIEKRFGWAITGKNKKVLFDSGCVYETQEEAASEGRRIIAAIQEMTILPLTI